MREVCKRQWRQEACNSRGRGEAWYRAVLAKPGVEGCRKGEAAEDTVPPGTQVSFEAGTLRKSLRVGGLAKD